MPRAFDFLLAVSALVLLLPVFVVIGVAVFMASGRPVFFRHERIGLGGQPFMLIKFRTMVNNANQLGSWSTQENDARITKVGKLLRATSLDELPQLWNVAKGEMAIVGPRPDVAQQRDLYSEDEWRARTSVKPGLTGLAQATRRSSATPDERKQLDLRYVRQRSFWLDLRIIWRTIWQVIFKGSY